MTTRNHLHRNALEVAVEDVINIWPGITVDDAIAEAQAWLTEDQYPRDHGPTYAEAEAAGWYADAPDSPLTAEEEEAMIEAMFPGGIDELDPDAEDEAVAAAERAAEAALEGAWA